MFEEFFMFMSITLVAVGIMLIITQAVNMKLLYAYARKLENIYEPQAKELRVERSKNRDLVNQIASLVSVNASLAEQLAPMELSLKKVS